MPYVPTASLRPDDPSGSERARPHDEARTVSSLARRSVVALAATVVLVASASAASAAGRHGSKSPPPRGGHTSVNPGPLWSTFPVGRPAVSTEHAIENSPRDVPAPKPKRGAGTQRHAGHVVRDVIVAAIVVVGVVLLVLVGRRPLRRRRPTPPPADAEPTRAVVLTSDWIQRTAARPPLAESALGPLDPSRNGAPEDHSRELDGRGDGHLLFVPTTTGYRLIERAGAAPPVRGELDGEELGLEGRFRVSKIVASPLPSDERDCAYLERT